jgi:hypothetical protein
VLGVVCESLEGGGESRGGRDLRLDPAGHRAFRGETALELSDKEQPALKAPERCDAEQAYRGQPRAYERRDQAAVRHE